MLYITIGTGKNGTHTLDALARLGMLSFHEPEPYLDREACAMYEGESGSWDGYCMWRDLVQALLRAHVNVHIANHHLTYFVPQIERDFGPCRYILPVRDDWRNCAAHTFGHGAYCGEDRGPNHPWHVHWYEYPRDRELRARWVELPRPSKCVWMWKTRNRVARAVLADKDALILRTEDIDDMVPDILEYLGLSGVADPVLAREWCEKRIASGDPDRRVNELVEVDGAAEYNDAVLRGDYDEEVPDL